MSSKPQRAIKVGDEIAFRVGGLNRVWAVYEVNRVTPSGRIRAGKYELNPDLTVRGKSGWGGPYTGHLVTSELRREISNDREKLAIIEKLTVVLWREISLQKLQKIEAILQEIEPE